jgi:hypothetical protein
MSDENFYGEGLPEPMQPPTWKIGEPGADRIVDLNCRVLDLVLGTLVKTCNAPGCGWGISALRKYNYEVPEFGEVCATCWDVYNTLTMANKLLKSTLYFRNHHEFWKAQQDANKRRWGMK